MSHDIAREVEKLADDLGIDRKRSIGEVAKELKVETHVIRFWEENFPQIKPEIGAGKRRYYYNKQLKILKRIKHFLYEEGYTVAGLQKLLKKRKHNDHKEEDLDIILEADVSAEERMLERNDEKEISHQEKKSSEIDLDDFIDPSVEIKVGAPIDPRSKLIDFANIKVAAIDPAVRQKVEQHLHDARVKLDHLKSLIK